MLAAFFFSSLFFMWPYQTMVQAQTFLSMKFPEAADSISPIMMICLTLPIFLAHCLFVFTGCGQRATYTCRIVGSCSCIILLVGSLCVIIMTSESKGLLLTAMYTAAFGMQCSGAFVQPAYFEMAGLLPSTMTSQAVQAGIGAAGVVVCGVQILARLASDGLQEASLSSLQGLTYFFLGLTATAAALQILLFFLIIRPSKLYAEYIDYAAHDSVIDAGPAAQSSFQSQGSQEISVAAARRIALRFSWPSVLCIIICFGATTLLWPSIAGVACVGSSASSGTLQSWWFEIIVTSFNIGDFLGRAEKVSLKWGARALSPMTQLALSLLRAAIAAPLILTASAPQLYSPDIAAWVVLVTIFFFGVSNGWLSTICYMRAPKALPADTPSSVAEQASTILAMGMYWGLFTGCILAYYLTSHPLKGILGKCHVSGSGSLTHAVNQLAEEQVLPQIFQ